MNYTEVCVHCSGDLIWSKLFDGVYCPSCRTSETTERRPQVGDSLMSSGMEHRITKVGLGLATIDLHGVQLDYFTRELDWSPEHGCWMVMP